MILENPVGKVYSREGYMGYVFFLVAVGVFTLIYFFGIKDKVCTEHQEGQVEHNVVSDKLEKLPEKEAVTLGDIVVKKGQKTVETTKKKDPGGKDKVVKQMASADGEYYYVAASLPDKEKAANLLAEVHRRSQYLVKTIDEQLDGSRRVKADDGVDITDNMRKLVNKHLNEKVPFAEYHNPHDKTVGSNADKGLLIEMCLRSKYKTTQWNSINTLFRVHVHELAHSGDHHFRGDGDEAHGPDFARIMNYLLQVSENMGLYSCAEYKASKRAFCGLKLTEEDTKCG